MSRAKKNMMKQLSIEELVDIYLNSDGETEKTACSEIEDRYWEEYEVVPRGLRSPSSVR